MSAADPSQNAARRRRTLAVTSSATFMVILDITVVNVALPNIEHSLGASLTDLEWVADAYALALGALLLIWGSVADRTGRKRVFLLGMAIFGIGSLLSSLAPSPTLLIGARVIQGVGAAALFATALALIGNEFEGAARGRALGVWGAAIGAGLAVGPIVGGGLTDAFGWRAIFLINVPLALAMLMWAPRMAESRAGNADRPDWAGFALFGTSLTLVVFSLIEGVQLGWGSPLIYGSLAGGIGGATVFFTVVAKRPGAIFDARLLANPSFAASTIAVAGQGVVIASVMLYLIRDLQDVGGHSPLAAGAEILPITVVAFVASLVAGRMLRGGNAIWLMSAALVLLAIGSGLLATTVPSGHWWDMLPAMLLLGAGWGATNPLASQAALGAAPPSAAGMVSGFNNTARQIGIAAGIGGLGTLYQDLAASGSRVGLGGVSPTMARELSVIIARHGLSQALRQSPVGLRVRVESAGVAGLVGALHAVELAGAAIAAACAIAVGFIALRSSRV